MTNVVTGHRLSFGTSSDVLAQQFAVMVGWVGNMKFPKSRNFAGLKLDSRVAFGPPPPFTGATGQRKGLTGYLEGSALVKGG